MAKESLIKIIGLDKYYLLRQLSLYTRLFFKYSTFKKMSNVIGCEYALLAKKTRLSSMPYAVKLEVNNICNLDCKFCYRKTLNYGFGYAKFEDFKKIFDQLKDYLHYCAPHYLGEPLLHKDICKILEYIHKNRVASYISTNMNYLNEELAKGLVKSGLDVLTVSIDGVNQETYGKYRRNGNFNLLIKNLRMMVQQKKKLKSKTPHIEIQFIVFKHNENQIDAIKKLAKSIGVDSLKIRPAIIDDKEWMPSNKMLISKLYKNKKPVRKTCWWLWRTPTISWNGYVYPCCRKIFKKPFGNALNTSFREIWNNKHFIESRKSFFEKKKFDTPCIKCKIPYGNIHG